MDSAYSKCACSYSCTRHLCFELYDTLKRPALFFDYNWKYGCEFSDDEIIMKAHDSKQMIGSLQLPSKSGSFICSPNYIKVQDTTPQLHLQVDFNRAIGNCTHPRDYCCDNSFHIFGKNDQKLGKMCPFREDFSGDFVVKVHIPVTIMPHGKAMLIAICYFLV